MKKILVTVLAVLLLISQAALADSVAGSWSGTMKVNGKKYPTSLKLSSGGSFSAKANGVTVGGKYSYSGDTVRLSSMGTSVTLSLSKGGSKWSLSGSTTYSGKSGSIYLSRSAPSSTESDTEGARVYGVWKLETDSTRGELWLYKGGYAIWREWAADSDAELADVELFAKLSVQNGKVTLIPLVEGDKEPEDFALAAFWDDASGTWIIPYEIKDKTLTVESVGSFAPGEETLEKFPAEESFRPYLVLRSGDEGEAIEWLQERLIDLGFLTGEADGVFGKQTQKAIKSLQKEHSLKVDGVAGPQVMAIIGV